MLCAGAAFEMRQVGVQSPSMRPVPVMRFRVVAAWLTGKTSCPLLASDPTGVRVSRASRKLQRFVEAMIGWGLFRGSVESSFPWLPGHSSRMAVPQAFRLQPACRFRSSADAGCVCRAVFSVGMLFDPRHLAEAPGLVDARFWEASTETCWSCRKEPDS